MKNHVLVLSNSNFFSVYSHLLLYRHISLTTLNVRYANEEMDKNEHLFQQLSEFYQDMYYKRGMIAERYLFAFNEQLVFRISKAIGKKRPNIILFEMKTFDETEWRLLKYLHAHFVIPIVVYISEPTKSQDIMFKLAESGVREVITQLEETLFINAFNRNI